MKTGVIGEEIAEKYLLSRGYTVLCRNFRRPWGEIDIVVRLGDKLFFVEVKATETPESIWKKTLLLNRPEERVTHKKLERLRKIVQTYLIETKREESDWSFVVCGVLVDSLKKRARVSFLVELL
jgi:putative endonuclease